MELRLNDLAYLKNGEALRRKLTEITTLVQGTGAELALSPQLLEYHDGTLTVNAYLSFSLPD
jgi:hypothetical protein